MKTKKILAILMALVMTVGMTAMLTACGEESSESQTDEETVVEETEPATEETSEVTEAVNECIALAGEYEDEVSQRAGATVTANTEAQSVNITVSWGTSAVESVEWTMNAVKEGNKLVYSDCEKRTLFYSEDVDEEGTGDEDGVGGEPEETVEYENGSGSFEISDGKLLWTGATDEQCQSCVFVPISE